MPLMRDKVFKLMFREREKGGGKAEGEGEREWEWEWGKGEKGGGWERIMEL